MNESLKRFKRFLERPGVVQREIADAAGVSEPYVTGVKHGRFSPSAAFVGAVADAMERAGEFSGAMERLRFELDFRNSRPRRKLAAPTLQPTGS